MRRPVMTLTMFGSAIGGLAVAGCSIAGSWKTMTVDPPGLPFPVDTVTFDQNHNYTATWSQEGEPRTSVGRYRWNGFNLEVMQAGGRPRSYGARLRLDGTLVLTYGQGEAKVVATLAKAEK